MSIELEVDADSFCVLENGSVTPHEVANKFKVLRKLVFIPSGVCFSFVMKVAHRLSSPFFFLFFFFFSPQRIGVVLAGLAALLAVWLGFVLEVVELPISGPAAVVVWFFFFFFFFSCFLLGCRYLPIYLLISFAAYSLGSVGYQLLIFRECPGAAEELQKGSFSLSPSLSPHSLLQRSRRPARSSKPKASLSDAAIFARPPGGAEVKRRGRKRAGKRLSSGGTKRTQ